MLLPGPEAQQLATYIGWLLHGVRGGIAAGLLFVAPGLALIIGLAAAYATFADASWLEAIFTGLKAAVLAIVLQALVRMGAKSLKGPLSLAFAATAFVALFIFGLAFPLVILLAGIAGSLLLRAAPAAETEPERHHRRKGLRAVVAVFVWGAIWLAPLGLMRAIGGENTFTDVFSFFVRVALFSFGGAYAVLSYVAQQAVTTWHWVTPAQMLDGLALAETTPGPLVLTLSFVGFLAGHGAPAAGGPLLSGIIAALLTAWAIFVPSFVFIFAGAPFIEDLRRNPRLAGALAGIGAATVGVIANLSVWFALHVLFGSVGRQDFFALRPFLDAGLPWPEWPSLDLPSLVLAVAAGIAIFRFRVGVVALLVAAGLAGLAIGRWL